MKGQLTDKIRIQHILDAITEVEKYLSGVSYEEFLVNSEKRFATVKQIEIIGEACNHITPELKQNHRNCMETNNRIQKHFHSRIFWRELSYCLGDCSK